MIHLIEFLGKKQQTWRGFSPVHTDAHELTQKGCRIWIGYPGMTEATQVERTVTRNSGGSRI